MDISLYILANAGKELSIDNIVETYKRENKEVSRRTVYNYLERMKKAYLIHGVGRYNIVGKSALSNKEKQYAIDMGFRTINTNTINYGLRHTYCSLMLSYGIDPRSLADQMGHSSPIISLNTYSHSYTESKQGYVNILNNALYSVPANN